jgi:hypothetical protein
MAGESERRFGCGFRHPFRTWLRVVKLGLVEVKARLAGLWTMGTRTTGAVRFNDRIARRSEIDGAGGMVDGRR